MIVAVEFGEGGRDAYLNIRIVIDKAKEDLMVKLIAIKFNLTNMSAGQEGKFIYHFALWNEIIQINKRNLLCLLTETLDCLITFIEFLH